MIEPSTDWRETIPPGEEAILLRHAEALRDLQRAHTRKSGPGRALHRKGHAGVRAEVTPRPDLPAHLRVGMFAEPRTYPAYVRFSNGSGALQRDGKGDVRGVALKVVGAPGKKLIPGMEDAKTQDFLMIRTPSTPFRDATEFVGVVRGASDPRALFELGREIGFGRLFAILRRLAGGLGEPVTTMAGLRYYSALPIRFGEYAAHYAFWPAGPVDMAPRGSGTHALRDDLVARLREAPLRFDLLVQLFVDEERTPIEDASVEWRESDSPFVPVADVVIPRQDLWSEAGRRVEDFVERLSFDPWHAPVDFRPLGNMMRARSHAYRLSVTERGAAPEPDGTERFDP